MLPASLRRSVRLQRLFAWSVLCAWLLVWLAVLLGALFLVPSLRAEPAQLIFSGGLFLGSGLAAAALIYWLRQLLFQPLEQLRAGAERLGQGELDHRLGLNRRDELGEVAHAFDQMASQLQQREAQVLTQTRALLGEMERRHQAEDEIQSHLCEQQQVEAALRESEARFRTLVGNLNGVVYRCAADARWTNLFLSDGIETLTGYPVTDFLRNQARTFESLIHPEDQGLVAATAARALESLQPFEIEYRLCTASGRVVWVLDRGRAIVGADGQPVWIDGVMFDVTRHKQLEADLLSSRERYELAVRGSTDGLWDWNLAANEVYFSPRWKALLGYAEDEVPDQFETWTGLIHPEDLPHVQAELAAYLKGDLRDYRVEFRMQHKDGSYRWIVARGVALRDADGHAYRMAGSHTDTTNRKQAEEEILRLNAELEQRVAERTVQLEQANAALEIESARLAERVAERTADLSAANAELARAARTKDEFLAGISHELRTPLNTILGMAEALQDEVYGPLTATQKFSLHNIEESGRHLLALINDLLDISKIEAGKLELQLERLEVAAVCEASLRLVRPAAQQKHLDVQLELDPAATHVCADMRRLKQILLNLLSNAVKFTPSGGALGLAVYADPQREAVTFTVWDTGIGIAAADLPKLFQPFTQLDSRHSRAHVGSGLGLTLVYRMTDLHDGGVSVSSHPGEGSRFSVTLPGQPAEAAGAPSRNERALLCQTLVDPAGKLAACLAELGFSVVPECCGPQAFELARAMQPPFVLLELEADAPAGWDLLRQLREDARTRNLPVIAIAAPDLAAQAAAQGAGDIIPKPATREQLRSAISGSGLVRRARTGQTGVLNRAEQTPAAPLILLADDNETRLLAHSRQMQALGYRSAIARSGQEALERALEETPALMVVNLRLAVFGAVELIRRLRAHPKTAATRILALSTLDLAGERERCLSAGATAYLCRPISPATLAQTVRACAGPLHERIT